EMCAKCRVVGERAFFHQELLAGSVDELADANQPGEGPLVNSDLSQIRIAKQLVLLAHVDIARRVFLVLSALFDVPTSSNEPLEVVRFQLARKQRRYVKDQ